MNANDRGEPTRWPKASRVCVTAVLFGVIAWNRAHPNGSGAATDRDVSEKPTSTADKNNPNARGPFERLFIGYDDHFEGINSFDRFSSMFSSGGYLTADRSVANARNASAMATCTLALNVFKDISPKLDAPVDPESDAEPRRRVVVCDVGASTEPALRKGDYDLVGDFMLVREEPHSTYQGRNTAGNDVDLLVVYVLADRVFRNHDRADDLLQKFVQDLGGYLVANLQYFTNSSKDATGKKADHRTVEKAGDSIIDAIVRSIEKGDASPMLRGLRDDFKRTAIAVE